MKYSILLADDDASIRFVLSKSLTKAGFYVRATDNAQTLLKWVKNGDGDVILTDVHMDADDIFTFVPEITKLRPELPIIIMSANTSVATALKSGNAGVFDYIPKPFDLKHLEQIIRRAVDKNPGSFEKPHARSVEAIAEPIIGKSTVMQPVFRGISDYMSADIPVFIYGDVGTGKDHVAKLIHASGTRAARPFVVFNDCASIDILEKTLAGGSLFVDRIHELPIERQSLLLRVLERNEQGAGNQVFRVISTANVSVEHIHKSGCVRPDLFFRLRGGEIYLPPLRERLGDIEALSVHFLNFGHKSKGKSMNAGALKKLNAHNWPGNVRELKSLMQVITLKYPDRIISENILKKMFTHHNAGANLGGDVDLGDLRAASSELLRRPSSPELTPYMQALAWVEKPLIEEALRLTGGNNLRAAELLGIHRNTLRTKIKTLGIAKE